jgi:hypothetical protein
MARIISTIEIKSAKAIYWDSLSDTIVSKMMAATRPMPRKK